MLYFITNQKNVLSIQDWNMDMSSNPAFVALNDAQIEYYNAYSEATPWEVKNLTPRPTQPTTPDSIDIEELRKQAIKNISDYSLLTMDKFVSTYQYANADSSLKVNDGEGIYTHEKATNVINKYNKIGKLCREEFYSVKSLIEISETENDINEIKKEAYDYYDSIDEDQLV